MKDIFRTSGFAFWLLLSLVWATGTTANAQTQMSYNLGAGDEVRLTVYGQPDLMMEGRISSDGTLEVPLIGTVQVAGHSSAEAAKMIAEYYRSGGYLQDAHVNLLVTRYRSQSISILGKVNQPGKLILEGPMTLTEALATAGGVAETGSEHLILIRADKKGRLERHEYDLQKLLNHEAEASPIVWLQDGDTLYVPIAGRFYVNGEVNSPGMYPLDRPLNVRQAVSVGGGPTPRANDRAVTLYRQQPNGSVSERKAKPDEAVHDGDVLVVQESLF